MGQPRVWGQDAPATILILTASTGGGHDRTATALAEALHAALPAVRLRVDDPLRTGAGRGALSVGRWYDRAVTHVPWLWGLFYHLTNHDSLVRVGTIVATVLWGRRLRRALHAARPDLVISVHPVCARLATAVIGRQDDAPPHHCVVTDLVSLHRCWAAPRVAAFYAPTPDAATALVALGAPSARVHVTGLPLGAEFAVPSPIALHSPVPTVLVLGGAQPTRALERVARALLAVPAPLCMTIVCGRNERLRRRLARIAQGRATVYGWRHDIAALMQASSVVVTKGGSVTLAEAVSQARPVLTYQALPGQETGNPAWLQREGLGAHVSDVAALPALIDRRHRRHGTVHAWERASWWGGASARIATRVAAALAARAAPTDRENER